MSLSPIKNNDVRIKNGDFQIKNCGFPIKNGMFTTGTFPIALARPRVDPGASNPAHRPARWVGCGIALRNHRLLR